MKKLVDQVRDYQTKLYDTSETLEYTANLAFYIIPARSTLYNFCDPLSDTSIYAFHKS
jgi:hypothetical protein